MKNAIIIYAITITWITRTTQKMDETFNLYDEKYDSYFIGIIDKKLISHLDCSNTMYTRYRKDVYNIDFIRQKCIVHTEQYNFQNGLLFWRLFRQIIEKKCCDENKRKQLLADWDNERSYFRNMYSATCEKVIDSVKKIINHMGNKSYIDEMFRCLHIPPDIHLIKTHNEWIMRMKIETKIADDLLREGKMELYSYCKFLNKNGIDLNFVIC